MKRILILAAALTAVSTTPALAEKTAPADKVFPFLGRFLAMPAAERGRMKLSYAVRHEGQMIPGLKATLVEKNGTRTPLPVNAEGYFDRLPNAAQLGGGPSVVLDVPADWKMGSLMDLAPALKPAQEYDVRELTATVNETNGVIGKAAGIASLMAPKMSGITFLKAESGVVVFADGHTAPLPEAKEMPYFRPEDHKGAVRVKLTKTPTKVAFYVGKK